MAGVGGRTSAALSRIPTSDPTPAYRHVTLIGTNEDKDPGTLTINNSHNINYP